MTVSLLWFLVTILTVLMILGATQVVESAVDLRLRSAQRVALLAGGVCVALLILMGFLYQVRGVVEVDGRFVQELVSTRGGALVEVMRVVTTMGDTVPCMVIAGAMAIFLSRQGGTGAWPLLLPALMLVELVLQFGYNKVFPVMTLSEVMADVPIDGSGSIPSGSTARLLSLFLVAAMINRLSVPTRWARWMPTLGGVLVLVEVFTRLYLGRHFLGDILGGFLLGILLSLACATLLLVARPSQAQSQAQAQPV